MLKEIKGNGLIKRVSVLVVCFVVGVILSLAAVNCCVSAKDTSSQVNQTVTDKMALIDKYQDKYFEIIKRNDVLLGCDDADESAKDMEELDNLFKEVEGQITNKKYLDKYKKIQKKYAECDAATTPEINAFAEKNYNEIDGLLNSVYKKAKSKAGDLSKLYLSQSRWSREVKNYKKVYDSKGFGTIGTSTYYSYMTNMEEFRTLLLMMYL